MDEIFDDRHQAIFYSHTYNKIAWLEVKDRQAADRMLAKLNDDVTLNHIETTETVIESRPVIHVTGKIIDLDFQLYLVWPVDSMTKSPT